MRKKPIFGMCMSIALAEIVGMLSALISGDIKWVYESLRQPLLSPPPVVFPIVWVLMYALMGIAAYMIFSLRHEDKKSAAIAFYIAQLTANFFWPILFFKFKAFALAALLLVLLLVLVVITMWRFYKLKRVAGLLMLPYLLWLCFALYLNVSVCLLN